MTKYQFLLLKRAITEHQSLVPPLSHQGTLQSCCRRGWLTEQPMTRNTEGAWYAVTAAGLDAVCTYQFATVYDATDDTIFLRQMWMRHF